MNKYDYSVESLGEKNTGDVTQRTGMKQPRKKDGYSPNRKVEAYDRAIRIMMSS